MIALRGKSYYCDARYHDMEPFHVKMAVVGAAVLMYNMACLVVLSSLRLLVLSGKGLIWLLRQPWKKLFASDMAKQADEPKPRQVAPKEQPKKIDVKYLN